jgi:ribosomal protein L10
MIDPPRVYPRGKEVRDFDEKKRYRYNKYRRLLDANTQSPIILLSHDKFSIKHLIRLRSAIDTAAAKFPSATPPPDTEANPPVSSLAPARPTLSIIRTGIFGVVLREYAAFDRESVEAIARAVPGSLAVLTLPDFNPPQLNAILRAIQRTVPKPKQPTPEELKARADAAKADPPNPGKRIKRQRPVHQPEMNVLGALVEGRVFASVQSVKEVAALPTLETLRAQLVGLLSSPATQLAAVLSEASGGKLARTLEGLKKGLEEEQGEGEAKDGEVKDEEASA